MSLAGKSACATSALQGNVRGSSVDPGIYGALRQSFRRRRRAQDGPGPLRSSESVEMRVSGPNIARHYRVAPGEASDPAGHLLPAFAPGSAFGHVGNPERAVRIAQPQRPPGMVPRNPTPHSCRIGVSAAIATGSAIRARPVVPVMVSSLVVIFAVIEILLLPFLAQHFLTSQPMVAGAWMGLAVKTDGAAVTSGAVTEAPIRSKALTDYGIKYKPEWIMGVTTMVKVFIDVFIGIWEFILAWIWSAKIDPQKGGKVKAIEIWQRFPKFVLGYMATFATILAVGLLAPALVPKAKAAMAQANVFRGIFFVMTFFTIGVVSNFRKLWQEGIGRLALVYVLCLFGFIIWIELAISWVFIHGVRPPIGLRIGYESTTAA